GIHVQFALMDGGHFMRMHEFDGIFDGDDVFGLGGVDEIYDSGKGRRFAGAGWAGNEDDAVLQLDDFLQFFGNVKFLEGRHLGSDDAHDDGVSSALTEDVGAEASDARNAV